MATIKTTKPSNIPCGFCSTGGRHDLCMVGILNGDGVTVIQCSCTEHGIRGTKCFDCGNIDYSLEPEHWEVDPQTWACIDHDACTARKEASARRAQEALGMLHPGAEAPKPRKVAGEARKPQRGPKTGECLHCGEATKGGLFLPGHDAAYLSTVTRLIKDETKTTTLQGALAAMEAAGCSEALRNKLAKRVAS